MNKLKISLATAAISMAFAVAAYADDDISATNKKQPTETAGRFFQSMDKAQKDKTLTGGVVDTDLKEEDQAFQLALQAQKDRKQGRIYDDLVKSKAFIGNPVLIRIDPPDESTAKDTQRAARDTLAKLVSTKPTKCEQFPNAAQLITNADRQYYGYLSRELLQSEHDFSDSQQDSLTARAGDQNASAAPSSFKYLLVLNYNIPAVRTGLLGQNYRIVRFGAHAFLRDTDSSEDYSRINLVSIYPTSELLKADLDDTTNWEVQAEGSWAGATAGHAKYSKTTDWKYAVNFPRVVGLGTNNGSMQWVYYPAKAQEITFGNKTAFALFTVPSDVASSALLQINALLEYRMRLLKVGSTSTTTRLVSLYTPLSSALHRKRDIDNFARMFGRTLPPQDEKVFRKLLQAEEPKESDADKPDTEETKETPKKKKPK